MRARRLALAWSAGASIGLLVGTILGSALGDLLQARATRHHAKALAASATAVRIPAQRDEPPVVVSPDEPCTRTLGGLGCVLTGEHTNHAYQSAWHEDRRERTDTEVE